MTVGDSCGGQRHAGAVREPAAAERAAGGRRRQLAALLAAPLPPRHL